MARESERAAPRSRRDLLVGLAALGAVAGGWQLWANRPQAFEFEPIEGLPGWRRIAFDGVSAGAGGLSGAALVGLDEPEPEPDMNDFRKDMACHFLYGDVPEDRVPMAVFTDFYCPFCRVLIRHLGERDDPRISITWHELPLLGPTSIIAARAAIAAGRQGGYVAFQSRLMGSQFRPTDRFLTEVAADAGLNGQQLLRDMNSMETELALRESRAVSRLLGVWGTPATVVGRTLVMGAISERDLSRLIDIEAEAGPLPC